MADRLQEGRHRQQQQYRPGCQPEQQTACNFIGREDEDVQRGIPATVPRNGFHDVLHTSTSRKQSTVYPQIVNIFFWIQNTGILHL